MFLIYGLQKSGKLIINFLEKKQQEFKVWDDNVTVRNNLQRAIGKKTIISPTNYNLNKFKKIFVSPGISLRQKKFQIKNKFSKLNRDLNLYISHINKQKVIAITGTNGKSTTTKLIGDLLKKNKINTFVGGNIGEPLCNSLISKKNFKYHVIELSSFQLETVKYLNTKISIITNLASDHLDRYCGVNDYINQKKNIITKIGTNLISIDDQYSKKIFLQNKIKNKISFSIFDKSANVYMGENYILDNYFKKSKKLFIKNISKDFEGRFNNQNILIAYICCKLLKLPETSFINVVKNFRGLPHRSKVIFENKNLKIINNSKSTNINSTINSIKNYNNIYLIMGGIAKEKNFDSLSIYKQKICYVYLFGQSAQFIENKLNKEFVVKRFETLKLLIKQVFKDLETKKDQSIILFAPSCSSYDQFKNFEERGNEFSKLIKSNLKYL